MNIEKTIEEAVVFFAELPDCENYSDEPEALELEYRTHLNNLLDIKKEAARLNSTITDLRLQMAENSKHYEELQLKLKTFIL